MHQYGEFVQDYESAMSYLATYPERYDAVKRMQAAANWADYAETPLDAYALGWTWHKSYAECENETYAKVQLVSYMLQESKFDFEKLLDIASTKQCYFLPANDVAADLLYRAMATSRKDKKVLGVKVPIGSNILKRVVGALRRLYPTKQSKTLQVSLWFLLTS
jgi:hypothetical protein